MAKKGFYTRKLGAEVASRAQKSQTGRYHVISGESQKWAVVSEGSIRPTRSFNTQKDAVDFAKRSASRKSGEVIIHGRTGQIRNMTSYAKK